MCLGHQAFRQRPLAAMNAQRRCSSKLSCHCRLGGRTGRRGEGGGRDDVPCPAHRETCASSRGRKEGSPRPFLRSDLIQRQGRKAKACDARAMVEAWEGRMQCNDQCVERDQVQGEGGPVQFSCGLAACGLRGGSTVSAHARNAKSPAPCRPPTERKKKRSPIPFSAKATLVSNLQGKASAHGRAWVCAGTCGPASEAHESLHPSRWISQ